MYAGGPMTAADWTDANPLLERFQFGFVKDPATGAITGHKVGDGVTRWNSLPFAITPYKVYRALLSQSGTDDPTATVLENTLGDVVWTRNSAGSYLATTTAGVLPVGQTFAFAAGFVSSTNDGTPLTFGFNMSDSDGSYLNLLVMDVAGSNEDIGNTLCVEILVYP